LSIRRPPRLFHRNVKRNVTWHVKLNLFVSRIIFSCQFIKQIEMLTNYRTRRAGMRVGTNIARMAYGASKALYKNRAAIKKAAKKLWKSKPSKPRKKTYNKSTTIRTSGASTGNELSVSKYKIGRYPALTNNRLFKLMKAGMNDVTLRYQGITNFDTNVGFHALCNRQDAAGNVINPVHIYDLTRFPNTTTSTSTAGYSFYWTSLLAGAALTKIALRGQEPSGSTIANGEWQFEKVGSGDFRAPYANTLLHDWVDIRLNLYGARKRGTTFYVQLVSFNDEYMNPLYSNTGNRQVVDWMRTMERSLIYSNLQSYNIPSVNRGMRVIKTYKVYVPGGSADDLDTIGKVKELRIFHRIGKVRKMKWESETSDALPHAQEDGIDYTLASGPSDYPAYKDQLFLIVRAFAPERRTVSPAGPETAADALSEPSYDIILRNKFTTPL